MRGGGLRRRRRENNGTANNRRTSIQSTHDQDFGAQQFQLYSENAPACNDVNAEDIDFTLVTQLSNDRLWMMKHHCDRWKSQISLAILTNRTYANIEKELVDLGCNMIGHYRFKCFLRNSTQPTIIPSMCCATWHSRESIRLTSCMQTLTFGNLKT